MNEQNKKDVDEINKRYLNGIANVFIWCIMSMENTLLNKNDVSLTMLNKPLSFQRNFL